ncbi:MAG TPA: hypothetical protein VMA13_06005 [Candidatus Saccharimonadales bacterium]|nr:hypothetical protein [Candidatus Saccharimonadales bacterium]
MKIFFRIVLLAALGALGVWLWTILFPSPEKIIRRRLDEVARHVSFAPNEGTLARVASAQSLADYFATNVEVNINTSEGDRQEFVGRSQITQAALGARSVVQSLKVKFLDVDVALAPGKQSATADLTVDANISGQPNAIVQEMKITLQKINGQWLITRVETIRILSILNFEPACAPSIV